MQKVLRVGLWWPTVHRDAKEYFQRCDVYQRVVLTGENECSPTGRVDPVRGCLNNPSRLG
jgi:hypothetical protein